MFMCMFERQTHRGDTQRETKTERETEKEGERIYVLVSEKKDIGQDILS